MKGTLFLVGTPIGNLADITLRALETLRTVDVIACEDTRHTLALLNYYEIKKPLVSYYKPKEKEGAEKIKELLDEGKNVALVTDAGMPCVSDPGSVLVRDLEQNGYTYTVVPGVTAVTSAASLVGTEKGFAFFGFLPEKTKEKKKVMREIAALSRPSALYCAPHDVNDTLDFLYEELGDRTVYLIKEITKIHETVLKGNLKDTRLENPKGEFVLFIEPTETNEEKSDDEVKDLLLEELKNGADKKTAVKILTEKYGVPKNKAYKLALSVWKD